MKRRMERLEASFNKYFLRACHAGGLWGSQLWVDEIKSTLLSTPGT